MYSASSTLTERRVLDQWPGGTTGVKLRRDAPKQIVDLGRVVAVVLAAAPQEPRVPDLIAVHGRRLTACPGVCFGLLNYESEPAAELGGRYWGSN
jgi:hypothetical protein